MSKNLEKIEKESETVGTFAVPSSDYSFGDEVFEATVDAKSDLGSFFRYLAKQGRDAEDTLYFPILLKKPANGVLSIITPEMASYTSVGQVGFIYITKEEIKEKFGWTNFSPKRKKMVYSMLSQRIDEINAEIRHNAQSENKTL